MVHNVDGAEDHLAMTVRLICFDVCIEESGMYSLGSVVPYLLESSVPSLRAYAVIQSFSSSAIHKVTMAISSFCSPTGTSSR